MATKAEQLLKDIATANKLSEQNAKEVIRATLKEELNSVIKESDYDETGVDDETIEGPDMGDATMDLSKPDTDLDMPPMETQEELPMMGDDDGDLDGQVYETLEDLMATIKDLDDDTQIEIVKSPTTFKIELTTEPAVDDVTESMTINEVDFSELGGENIEEEVSEEIDNQHLEELDQHLCEVLEEEQASMNEAVVARLESIIMEYETKLNAQTKSINTLTEQNKKLVNENKQFVSVMTEAKASIGKLALDNTNLAHISKLFTEATFNVTEKRSILEKFTGVKSINESKTLFSTLLTEQKNKPVNPDVKTLKTELKEEFSKEKIELKEEKVFESTPFLNTFSKIVNYKPKK